ncbi:MAG TPA: glycosyltransferase [Gammaproteobacteria bacterium]|nr:glycosyltransferase [Gammaproteobacteria bacterium]
MKVLFVVPHNIVHETDMIIGLKHKGVDARVVAGILREPDASKLAAAGIALEHIPFASRIDRNAVRKLRGVLSAFKPDIVHAFNNKTVSNGLLACKGMPVKFIAYRGIVGNVSFLNPGSWMTYLNPRVNRIVCVAEAIREYLLNIGFLWLRIPPHKLVTIHKGHDLAWYQAAPHNLAEFGISENDFVVGCITNYRPRKGIEKIVEAASMLPRELNVHFLLIGNMQNTGLARLLARSSARDRIHLAGFRADAPRLQAACDACILPSLKREGLPKSIIEGMAYGLPAIVTDSGGSPELVEHGVSGLIVPPASAQAIAAAVTELRSNPQRCEQMGAAARKRIEEYFSIGVTIDKTFSLYRELILERNQDGA